MQFKNKRRFIILVLISVCILSVVAVACNTPKISPGYTIYFDSMGGTPVEKITGIVDGSFINEPPAPQKKDDDNAVFEGWFKERACVNEWDWSNDKVNGSMTLYAKWNVPDKRYNVTFELNDGSGNSFSVMTDGDLSMPNTPKRDNYYFFDWWLSDDSGETLSERWNFENKVERDMTLYAFWKMIPKHLYLNPNFEGGEEIVLDLQTEECSVPGDVFMRNNYTFMGWATSPDGEVVYRGGETLPSSEMTLYAKWENAFIYVGSSTYTITGLTEFGKNSKELRIASEIDGKPITAIASGAFEEKNAVEKIIIGEDVKTIGKGALKGCVNLKEISLPYLGRSKDDIENTHFGYIFGAKAYMENAEYVPPSLQSVMLINATKIDENAFYGCYGIEKVGVSDSVTSIGKGAFSGCAGIQELSLPFVGKSIDAVGAESVFGYIFGTNSYNGGIEIQQFYSALSATYILPVTLKNVAISSGYIKAGAFCNCAMLENIALPKGVTEIGNMAFSGCYALSEIIIPDTVEKIGESAFNSCYSLVSVVIPGKVSHISARAFGGCTGAVLIFNGEAPLAEFSAFANIKALIVEENNLTAYKRGFSFISNKVYAKNFLTEDGYLVYQGKLIAYVGIGDAVLPSDIVEIAPSAFRNNRRLTSVILPDGLKRIGNYAFAGCTSMSGAIVVHGSVIGANAFSGCTELTEITLSTATQIIEGFAFAGCTGLSKVNYFGTEISWNNIQINANGNSYFLTCERFYL